MDVDFTCRGLQYELGRKETAENIKLCKSGFHYCTNLFDIFNYYSGEYDKDFIICEVEVDKVK